MDEDAFYRLQNEVYNIPGVQNVRRDATGMIVYCDIPYYQTVREKVQERVQALAGPLSFKVMIQGTIYADDTTREELDVVLRALDPYSSY